jgi:hypothetical protein
MNLNQFRTEQKRIMIIMYTMVLPVEGLTDERTIRINIKEKTNRF